jgi:hypothetical protein
MGYRVVGNVPGESRGLRKLKLYSRRAIRRCIVVGRQVSGEEAGLEEEENEGYEEKKGFGSIRVP